MSPDVTTNPVIPPACCDVLVIGSGAGGLSAAVAAARSGLSVCVVEKTHWIGGTTAWSGGWLWIPGNPLAPGYDGAGDVAQAHVYLDNVLGSARAADPRVTAFLENAPRMVQWFMAETSVKFGLGASVPDFYERPGASYGGRAIYTEPFDGARLGHWQHLLRPPLDIMSLFGMGIAGGVDLAHFLHARRSPRSVFYVARRIGRHLLDRITTGRGRQLVNGNALVARLLHSALEAKVRVHPSTPALGLVREGGTVTGAVVSVGTQERVIRAHKGVVLATGGFPHDQARLARVLKSNALGAHHFSAAPASNTGDGLRLGEAVGSIVDDQLSSPVAWAPVSLVPDGQGACGHFPHLMERAKPGFIIVGRDARRFVNEADSYHDVVRAAIAAMGETPDMWLIGDSRAVRRFGIGAAKPAPFRIGPWVRNGYLRTGATLAELASRCGLNGETLRATVAEFNTHAAQGIDPQFQRGQSSYNRVQGDAGHQPNSALGPLSRGPYYALRLVTGSLGTFAGLKTDAHARVLDREGEPIPGLFAVGADMSSIMQGEYPSGGVTLGPAMTFGFIAGRVLAGTAS